MGKPWDLLAERVDIKLGIAIAIAIAIHNIPEGIAVSAPVYKATGSRSKAFLWSFLSGVVEPIGAVLTALVLLPYLNSVILGYILRHSRSYGFHIH